MNLTTHQNSVRSTTANEAQIRKVNIKSKEIGLANEKSLKNFKLKLQGKSFLEVKDSREVSTNSARAKFKYRLNFHNDADNK